MVGSELFREAQTRNLPNAERHRHVWSFCGATRWPVKYVRMWPADMFVASEGTRCCKCASTVFTTTPLHNPQRHDDAYWRLPQSAYLWRSARDVDHEFQFAVLNIAIVVITYSRQPESLAQELLSLEARRIASIYSNDSGAGIAARATAQALASVSSNGSSRLTGARSRLKIHPVAGLSFG